MRRNFKISTSDVELIVNAVFGRGFINSNSTTITVEHPKSHKLREIPVERIVEALRTVEPTPKDYGIKVKLLKDNELRDMAFDNDRRLMRLYSIDHKTLHAHFFYLDKTIYYAPCHPKYSSERQQDIDMVNAYATIFEQGIPSIQKAIKSIKRKRTPKEVKMAA